MSKKATPAKGIWGFKPNKLDEMYLIDEPVKVLSKLEVARNFLIEIGENPKDHNLQYLVDQGYCDGATELYE